MPFDDLLIKLEAVASDVSLPECLTAARELRSFFEARKVTSSTAGVSQGMVYTNHTSQPDEIFAAKLLALLEAKRDLAVVARVSIIQSLGSLGSTSAFTAPRCVPCDALIKCLKDGDWCVRRVAAEAMGSLASIIAFSRSDLDALLQLVGGPNVNGVSQTGAPKELLWMVRRAAILSLSTIDQKNILGGDQPDAWNTERSQRAAGSEILRGVGWFEFQSAALQRVLLPCVKDRHPAIREAVVLCVRHWSKPASANQFPSEVEALFDHSDAVVRKSALDIDSQIIGMRPMKSSDAGLPDESASDLIGIAALPQLISILESETSAPVRRAAVHVAAIFCRRLKASRNSSQMRSCLSGALLNRLRDENPWVRGAAVEAVGSLGLGSVAAAELAKRLKDSNWLVRAVAASSISDGASGIQSEQTPRQGDDPQIQNNSEGFSIGGVVESLGALWQSEHPERSDVEQRQGCRSASDLLEAQIQDHSWWLQNISAEVDAARCGVDNISAVMSKEADEGGDDGDEDEDETGLIVRGRSRTGTGSMDELMLERLTVGGSSSNGSREQSPNFDVQTSVVRPSSPDESTAQTKQRLSIFGSWHLPSATNDAAGTHFFSGATSISQSDSGDGDSAAAVAIAHAIAKASPRSTGWV
jgi:hypothetical protein